MNMRAMVCSFLLFTLGACSSLGSLSGVCGNGDRDLPVSPDLMQSACNGNKSAALEVGIEMESLADLESDESLFKSAARFYAFAAASSNGQTFIYVPGAGDVPGYTMPVTTGPATYGLPEAKFRLAKLMYSGKGIRQDKKQACKLFLDSKPFVIKTDPDFVCD